MRDQLPAAAGAAWALGLAYLVPRVVQDPLVVRRTLGVLPSLPGWVHVLALVLLWTVACVVAGVGRSCAVSDLPLGDGRVVVGNTE